MFAATPPLEAKKLLFSLFASMLEMCLDFIDAARAYFHARARREMHVVLPRENHEDGMRGKLGKAMHDTSDAAQSTELGVGVHGDDDGSGVQVRNVQRMRVLSQGAQHQSSSPRR